MYKVSDRSLRRYRANLGRRVAFHIELRTDKGPVDIYVDKGGYAAMFDPVSKTYPLSLGDAAKVVHLIARGDPLPVPTPLDFRQRGKPVELTPANAQCVDSPATPEPVPAQAETGPVVQEPATTEPTSPAKERRQRTYTGDIPNARRVIQAALSGAKSIRAKRDVLKTLPDGTREWSFTRRHHAGGHWKVAWTEAVAIFTPSGEFTCPYSEQPVVLHRQEILRQVASTGGEV